MDINNAALKNILETYSQITTLSEIASLLEWDMNVNLPPSGAQTRAKQSAFLTEQLANQWQDPSLLHSLSDLIADSSNLSELEQAIVRVLDRASKVYRLIPKEIIIEQSRVTSEAFMAWQSAKHSGNFTEFEPHLDKIIDLSKTIADHLGYQDNPYDALLDLYDQGLTAATCKQVFGQIQKPLSQLVQRIKSSHEYQPTSPLIDGHYQFDETKQRHISLFVLQKMGYNFEAGRMDVALHPFSTEIGQGDTRVTTRYLPDDFRSSYNATMHEGGHALYTQGINPKFAGLPLKDELSYAIHESQSRFWENHIGRHPQFVAFMAPIFQATFPDQLGATSTQELVKLFNLVYDSPIRIEADEVSYCLHIIVRFELENDLINQKLKVKDLPEAWNAKVKDYLGIDVSDNRLGVLQDVHWSNGYIGYFPSYALGNLYAAQFTHAMAKSLDLDQLVSQGNLLPILAWLRENIHQYGSRYTADELANRVTGQSLNPTFYLDYLEDKYSKIYSLKSSNLKLLA